MELGIRGKVAVVAAASQGIGKAIARALAEEGARVAICARTKATLEAAADEIARATGAEIFSMPVDVTVADQVHEFVQRVQERWGTVHISVTNAGGPPAKNFLSLTIEEWQAAVALNLMSTLYFVREVIPLMQQQRWGRLITITSVAVKQPIDGLILSNTVRAGVVGLVKSLANEFGKDNITVNNVCPGYTATKRLKELAGVQALAAGITAQELFARWGQQIPLGRIGTPEELAALVAFLASEKASYITGTSIAVDGGYVKGVF